MKNESRLPVALLALRLSVFLVMLVWTLDKFFAPGHAASVFENFYFMEGMGNVFFYAIGAVELVIVIGFLLGIARRFTYGAVFLFHAVSTLASFQMYLNPAEGRLFFAAWPMLAACFALYLLRDRDTMWTLSHSAA
ncbi:MAG: DoxX family membrane protein [Woeseia sp.]